MILNRWNWKTRKYEPYEVSNNWSIATLVFGKGVWVDCASCGACIPYEATYTSLEIHTPIGIGYMVCEKCYDEECERMCGNG